MQDSKTLCQRVREDYGDTIEQFAQRFNTSPDTVERWESGQEMQEHAAALLDYAINYPLAIHSRVSDEFAKLTPREQLNLLMKNFGDTQKAFARRINVSEYNISRWKRLNIFSPIAQRYIYEVAVHPERFFPTPKSYTE